MNAALRGVSEFPSAALRGTMHSRNGNAMQVPAARNAWRRLMSQDWGRKFMVLGSLFLVGKDGWVVSACRCRSRYWLFVLSSWLERVEGTYRWLVQRKFVVLCSWYLVRNARDVLSLVGAVEEVADEATDFRVSGRGLVVDRVKLLLRDILQIEGNIELTLNFRTGSL